MKKFIIILLTAIFGSLLMQSCFCEHDFFGPDYGYGYPPPPPHRYHVVVW
ncbi:MAG: hypothetical protein IKN44_05260 [Bacteroidaceae bacterium]|jgi:hypothetical protein|nr:hypothetical protein [Bacteroidaceae bacterium]MBR3619145.1 hypothetical protein [Bacteroidaceae bacterium]